MYPSEFYLRNIQLSLTPLDVQVRHMENLLLLYLALTMFYLCQFSRHEQIQDESVSSLMMFLLIVKYFIIMKRWILCHLLYCVNSLSLDKFPNFMSMFTSIMNHFWIYSNMLFWVFSFCCTVNSDGSWHWKPLQFTR